MHVCTYVLIPIKLHTYISILFHMSCLSTLLGGNQTGGGEDSHKSDGGQPYYNVCTYLGDVLIRYECYIRIRTYVYIYVRSMHRDFNLQPPTRALDLSVDLRTCSYIQWGNTFNVFKPASSHILFSLPHSV